MSDIVPTSSVVAWDQSSLLGHLEALIDRRGGVVVGIACLRSLDRADARGVVSRYYRRPYTLSVFAN